MSDNKQYNFTIYRIPCPIYIINAMFTTKVGNQDLRHKNSASNNFQSKDFQIRFSSLTIIIRMKYLRLQICPTFFIVVKFYKYIAQSFRL